MMPILDLAKLMGILKDDINDFFRTDANEEIATGHVMRCMTVGEELIKRGQQVKFLVSDMDSTKLLKDKNYEYTVLNSKWNFLDNVDEINKMKIILQENYEKNTKFLSCFWIPIL